MPTTCAVQATIQVIDQLKAVEISGCSENTEQVADTEVHDVTFTLPPITSTPHHHHTSLGIQTDMEHLMSEWCEKRSPKCMMTLKLPVWKVQFK